MPFEQIITINPHEDGIHCGDCKFHGYTFDETLFCFVFQESLENFIDRPLKFDERLPACIEAERLSKEGEMK